MNNDLPVDITQVSSAAVHLPPARIRPRTRPAVAEIGAAADPVAPTMDAARDYAVGYAKPPKHTRFKPGSSGNPRGRPRSAKGLNTIVRETLTQKVAVRTSSGEKRISRIEAVLQKTVEQAMKGNPRALAELIKLYGNAVADDQSNAAAHQEPDDLTEADFAILAALRSEFEAGAGELP